METKTGDHPEKKPADDIVVVISGGTEPTSTTPDRPSDNHSSSISKFSKSNSRLIEPSHPTDAEINALRKAKLTAEEIKASTSTTNTYRAPQETVDRSASEVAEDEESDDEVYKTASLTVHQANKKKSRKRVWFEWTVFVCLACVLVASLTSQKLRDVSAWGLELWKWTVLVLVIFSGRLVTKWLINLLVFLMSKNFLVNKKFLYFVYGTKTSVQVFIWFGLVLLAWELLINHGVTRPRKTRRILDRVTKALACCLLGAGLWLVKAFLIKLLASSFLGSRFFDRIQESLFHQYVVKVLSGPPLIDANGNVRPSLTEVKFLKVEDKETKQGVVDVSKVSKIKQPKVSSWTMTGLVDAINGSEFTFPDPDEEDQEGGKKDSDIKSEWGARAAAYHLFNNVANPKHKYIEKEDLLRFLKKEDVDNVFPLFEGAETGKIRRKALKNWLVKVYLSRKALAHSLNDTKTAIEELNRLASGIVFIISVIVGLLLLKLLTSQVLLFIGSQLLLVAFMFGSTAKNMFEAIIFVFVMHPYDVGDRCIIDGVQMVVEEMNILTTIFLRYDNQKIYYPNSVLSTKPIGNYYRSPDMGDTVEFSVHFSTSLESIGALKAEIKKYLESKPKLWSPKHVFVIKEIEEVNKIKMALYFNHTINFQDMAERNNRRSELVLKLKSIFEELKISYQLLPQKVEISYV